MNLDCAQLSREFLRALRGKRSQIAFSRRLGFRSNVAAEWESGRRVPLATTALRAGERSGVSVRGAFAEFRPATRQLLPSITPQHLAAWLGAQRGKQTITAVAAGAGLSRHQTSRFLSGRCQPRLHELFALVQACSGRLSDLVAALVDVSALPSLAERHAQVVAARRLAFEEPWSSAIVAALECLSERGCAEAESAVARALSLPAEDVQRCLARLEQAHVVERRDGRFAPGAPLVVDTTAAPEAARDLRRHWAAAALERLKAPAPADVFSYNVFSVSRQDLARIAELQREHFQRVRAIVAQSAPETVALVNWQLVEWDPAAG